MDRKKKVLVVDDSATVRKILKAELGEQGFDVLEAANGIEALDKVLSDVPDLITLDVDMPRMNGFDTCRKLSDEIYTKPYRHLEDKRVPIVIVTSNDTLEDRIKGFGLGATDFITKPFNRGEIAAVVKKILNPGKRLENLTALVVDDSSTARKIVKRIMEREGVSVIEAVDGEQAFEVMCNKMAEIDILITDLLMPKMNGDELCWKIRTLLNLKDIPIIFLTAMSEQSELLDLFKAGGTDYIVKPFVKEELLARLTVHLERAQLNTRLRKSVNELRGLNVMKDNLLSVCSHDLRTPLSAIIGFTDIMLQRKDMNEEDRQNITDIRSSGELLLGLVNDLLDLSRLESEETIEILDIAAFDIAMTSYNAMKHMAQKKNQQLELSDKSEGLTIPVNKTGMVRVINNLLSNAIKFTPEQGKIILEVDSGYSRGMMNYSVSDTGVGIPEDKMPSLFDRFAVVSKVGTAGETGTGLGMSIVKEIVEKHGGSVHVHSRVGTGTTFRIEIPMGDSGWICGQKPVDMETNGQVSMPERTEAHHSPGELKILVAEDSKMNAKVVMKLLTGCGHRVKVVENGLLAVEAVSTDSFDAILMDMDMPEMDGIEAAKTIRASGNSETPIIALTANTGRQKIKECLDSGMNDFIAKPCRIEDIRAKLKAWCSD